MSGVNGVMMQYFHWYLPPNGSLWNQLSLDAEGLAAAGFTALWLPPAYKGANGGYDVGYAVYDLFDLGEFEFGLFLLNLPGGTVWKSAGL